MGKKNGWLDVKKGSPKGILSCSESQITFPLTKLGGIVEQNILFVQIQIHSISKTRVISAWKSISSRELHLRWQTIVFESNFRCIFQQENLFFKGFHVVWVYICWTQEGPWCKKILSKQKLCENGRTNLKSKGRTNTEILDSRRRKSDHWINNG